MATKTESAEGKDGIILQLLLAFLILAVSILAFYSAWTFDDLKETASALQKKLLIRQEDFFSSQKQKMEMEEFLQEYLASEMDAEQLKKEYFDRIAQLESQIINGESNLKIAYLTFDDGPYYKSQQFLDVLDEYDIPATFFYLMKGKESGYIEEDAAYDAIYRRIIDSGHTLGNHTSTHKLGKEGIYWNFDLFKKTVTDNKDFIYNRYGYTTEVFRYPGGSGSPGNELAMYTEYIVSQGYGYVDWNAATGDGGALLSPEEYRDNVLNHTDDKKILVVLMHDYSANTLIALPEIIEGLSRQGYIFLPLFHDSIMCKK